MQKDFNRLIRRKKLMRRWLSLLLLTLVFSAAAVSMRDCARNFDEPYNKDYRPMDQIKPDTNSKP